MFDTFRDQSIDRRDLLVIAVAIMCVTPLPVTAAAANDKLVVGSQHTTADHFNSGTLDNMTVEGSGTDASVVFSNSEPTIDGFEDSDISEYGGDTTAYSTTTSTVYNGTSSLAMASDTSVIQSTNGLSSYPQQGQNITVYHYTQSQGGVVFFAQDEDNTISGYFVRASAGNDALQIYRVDSGTFTLLSEKAVTVDAGKWYRYEILPKSGGTIKVSLSQNGTYLQSVTANDGNYTSGGIGFRGAGVSGARMDYISRGKSVESGSYVSQNHSVSNAKQAAINVTAASNVSATLNIEYWDGSKWVSANKTTVTTAANHTLQLPSVSSSTWRANITVDKNGSNFQFTLADESILFTNHDPKVDNASASPSGGKKISDTSVQLNISVSDADFGTAQGENLTVTFYDASDDSKIGTDTLSSNNTATTTWDSPLGNNSWYVVVKDDYGGSTRSDTFYFETPNKLTIREEHAPGQLVNNSTVTIRFFTVDGDIAIQRKTSDGTINMSGLPESEFIVFVESENHYTRQIYISTIFKQSNLFLLNSTEFPRNESTGTYEAIRSRFVYSDLTGSFPQSVTTIQIQRAIDLNGNGTSEFRTVSGGYWGASNEYGATLEHGVRYRIVLVNQKTGARTVSGTHIPTADRKVPIRVTGLVEKAKNASGVVGLAEYSNSSGAIQIAYRDPVGKTDELHVIVEERGGSTELLNTTIEGPLGTYSTTVNLNESQQKKDWIVKFDAGKRHHSVIPVGSGSIALPVVVPGWLMTLMMSMAVTFVASLYGPRTAVLGAWSMVFVAAGVTMFGWAFSPASVVVAALVAVGATLMERAVP